MCTNRRLVGDLIDEDVGGSMFVDSFNSKIKFDRPFRESLHKPNPCGEANF